MRNLWEINGGIRHLTQEKPESLLERIILLGSKQGDTILDPFAGSGTTGVVAKRLQRHFIGFEISPDYFKIALNRINDEKTENKVVYSEKLLKQSEQLNLFLEEKANEYKAKCFEDKVKPEP